MACCDIQSGQARMYKCHDLEVEEENRADTVKSRVLTRLVQKHMMAFSDCLRMGFLILMYFDLLTKI